MKEIKMFDCSPMPIIQDVLDSLEIAKTSHCIVRLTWYVPHSGEYRIDIHETDEPHEIYKQIPTVYGV